MTLVTGLPTVPAGTPLRIHIEYDTPYQGAESGRGTSLKHYDGYYDWTNSVWRNDIGGGPLEIPLPRTAATPADIAVQGRLYATVSAGTGDAIVRTRYRMPTYETTAGQVDFTIDPHPVEVLPAQSLIDGIAAVDEARAVAQDGQQVIDELMRTSAEVYDTMAFGLRAGEIERVRGAVEDIPATPGIYWLPDLSGQVWERKADGSLTRLPGLESGGTAAFSEVKTAIGHTTAASLSAQPTTAGPQYYQGYRWLERATGPANGITVLAAANGKFWQREYDGPVYLRWANPAPGANIEPLLTSLLAPGQPVDIVLPAEAYVLGGALSMVTGQLIMGAGKGKTRLDYTSGLAAAVTMTQATSGVTAGGGLQDLTLNDVAGKAGGHVGMLVRGVNSTEFLTRVEVANFNVGLRLGANASDQNYFNTAASNHFASCLIGVQFLGAPNDNAFNFNTYTNCDYAYDFSTAGNVAEHNVFTGENVEGCKNWRLDGGVGATFMQTWVMLRLENPTTNTYVCEAVDPGRQLILGLAIVPDEGSNTLANDPTPANRRGVRWSLKAGARWSTRLGTRGSSYPHAYGAMIDEALGLAGTWDQPLSLAGGTWVWGESGTGRLMTKAGPKPTSNLDGQALDGYEGQATVDPPSIAAGAAHSFTVTCGGAALGDYAFVSSSADLGAVGLSAHVSAPNTVRVTLINGTGATLDLPSTTFRVRVQRPRGS